jgi:hypothetical protein
MAGAQPGASAWSTWEDWMKSSNRAQRLGGCPFTFLKPPGACLLQRTTTKAHRADRRQTSLLDHIRPTNWNVEGDAIGTDVLSMIVEALMRARDARAIRALSVVNRQCANAVRSVLTQARIEILEAVGQYEETLHRARARLEHYEHCESEELMAVIAERRRARVKYAECMRSFGFGESRIGKLLHHAGQRWFHDTKSILGHLHDGCELCDSEESQDCNGAGPVALFACPSCACTQRVRFCLWKKERVSNSNERVLLLRFPRSDCLANNYACALLSKRELHRRRMASKHSNPRLFLPLSRRVHEQSWTNSLAKVWQQEVIECNGHPPISINVELWHALPHGIPAALTFASVMGLRVAESTLAEADRHGFERRRARAATDARRHAFYSLVDKNRSLVCAVRRLHIATGNMSRWCQIVDLCCAARAFPMRWLFSSNSLNWYSWKSARYKLLEIDKAEFASLVCRIGNVARILEENVRNPNSMAVDGNVSDRNTQARACVLEIVRHLPISFLHDEEQLQEQVVHLRAERIRMRLITHGSLNWHRLNIAINTNPSIVKRQSLVLSCELTSGLVAKLCALAEVPTLPRLNADVVRAIEKMANSDVAIDSTSDRTRAALFKLPGGWPSTVAWEAEANARATGSA